MEHGDYSFGNIRNQAFVLWEKETNRDCSLVNDDITGSFECRWQDRATSEFRYDHISIFCSLGEWANNISDNLKDKSCDNHKFVYDEDSKALFRYYTRILLITSEILTDFQDIIKYIDSLKTKEAREFLSDKNGEIDSFFEFVNKVCKHKTNEIHLHNHHLPIGFEDCEASYIYKGKNILQKPISIANLDLKESDGILIPKLSYFIQVILKCYISLDKLFEEDTEKFKMICTRYNGISYET